MLVSEQQSTLLLKSHIEQKSTGFRQFAHSINIYSVQYGSGPHITVYGHTHTVIKHGGGRDYLILVHSSWS
jgi:hypothetical protein